MRHVGVAFSQQPCVGNWPTASLSVGICPSQSYRCDVAPAARRARVNVNAFMRNRAFSRYDPFNRGADSLAQALGTQLMTNWYLVWIEGLRGPEPQKWSSDALWGQLGRQDVIVRFPLTDEESRLPLNQLARRYPAPRE